jgi:hypothetical protein
MTEAINIAKSANSSGTQQLRSWSKVFCASGSAWSFVLTCAQATSKIYQTKIASWTVKLAGFF